MAVQLQGGARPAEPQSHPHWGLPEPPTLGTPFAAPPAMGTFCLRVLSLSYTSTTQLGTSEGTGRPGTGSTVLSFPKHLEVWGFQSRRPLYPP